jgi:hypothetical protein
MTLVGHVPKSLGAKQPGNVLGRLYNEARIKPSASTIPFNIRGGYEV